MKKALLDIRNWCGPILTAYHYYESKRRNQAFEVTVEKSKLRDVVEVVAATGKIYMPETELKITSDVSGEITEMLVKEGEL